jgi:hypothetical protein
MSKEVPTESVPTSVSASKSASPPEKESVESVASVLFPRFEQPTKAIGKMQKTEIKDPVPIISDSPTPIAVLRAGPTVIVVINEWKTEHEIKNCPSKIHMLPQIPTKKDALQHQ